MTKYQRLINELLNENEAPTILDDTIDMSAFDECIVSTLELEALVKDDHTNSLAIRVFLYERWQRIKNQKKYNYHGWPYSHMNEICIKLAQEINPYGWIKLIMPDEHPHQTCDGLTTNELYQFDTTGHTPLYHAIQDDNVELLEDYVRVAGLEILRAKCGPNEYDFPATIAALAGKAKILGKILELIGDHICSQLPLHFLAKSDSTPHRNAIADMLIEVGGFDLLNNEISNESWGLHLETPLDVALRNKKDYSFAAFLLGKNGIDVKITHNLLAAAEVNDDVLRNLIERKDIATLTERTRSLFGQSHASITQATLDALLAMALQRNTGTRNVSFDRGIMNLVNASAQAPAGHGSFTTCIILKEQGGLKLDVLLKQGLLFKETPYQECVSALAPAEKTTAKLIILYAHCLIHQLPVFSQNASELIELSTYIQKNLHSLETQENITKVDKLRFEILKIQMNARNDSSFFFCSKLPANCEFLPIDLRGPLVKPSAPEETPTSHNVSSAKISK